MYLLEYLLIICNGQLVYHQRKYYDKHYCKHNINRCREVVLGVLPRSEVYFGY